MTYGRYIYIYIHVYIKTEKVHLCGVRFGSPQLYAFCNTNTCMNTLRYAHMPHTYTCSRLHGINWGAQDIQAYIHVLAICFPTIPDHHQTYM